MVTKLKAKFHSGAGIELENLDVVFAEHTKIILPHPVGHTEPIRRLSASGQFSDNGRIIELRKMTADLNGPILNLSVKLSNNDDKSGSNRYRVRSHQLGSLWAAGA